jgi:hypothetical protein
MSTLFQDRSAAADARPGAPLNDTRYLCAAAYLDSDFQDRVLRETLEDPHRAVVPSFGFDLDAVVRHCLRARRLKLIRDVLLALLLVVGLVRATGPTICWIVLGVLIGALTSQLRHGQKVRGKTIGLAALLAGAALIIIGYLGAPALTAAAADGSLGAAVGVLVKTALTSWASWLGLTSVVVELVYQVTVHRVVGRIALGDEQLPGVVDSGVRQRLAYLARAQWGNVIVHGGYRPFLGAGSLVGAWSIALELRAAGDRATRVDVDPVAAHRAIAAGLRGTHAEDLPVGARISDLVMEPVVIARGPRRTGDVLVPTDTDVIAPRSTLDAELLDDIIRHPQAGLRVYQQVTVKTAVHAGTGSTSVWTDADTEQEVSTSAFVYLAVEGGMLYVECVCTLLPPIRREYRMAVDDQAAAGADSTWPAVTATIAGLPTATGLSPLAAVSGIAFVARLSRGLNDAGLAPADARAYNYGARTSIRELAAASNLDTYLQHLDAEKYTKLIEMRISTALLGFLRGQGVDTSEFENRVNVVHNHGVMISGGQVSGAVAVGAGSHASVRPST